MYCSIVYMSTWQRIGILSEHIVLYSLKVHSAEAILHTYKAFQRILSNCHIRASLGMQFSHTNKPFMDFYAIVTYEQAFYRIFLLHGEVPFIEIL